MFGCLFYKEHFALVICILDLQSKKITIHIFQGQGWLSLLSAQNIHIIQFFSFFHYSPITNCFVCYGQIRKLVQWCTDIIIHLESTVGWMTKSNTSSPFSSVLVSTNSWGEVFNPWMLLSVQQPITKWAFLYLVLSRKGQWH